ncbi:MAG: preprotein translocase subunit SecG [Opitutales bacterium TMED158]|nr:MAG: preprotein translocase subunit SecG [Opitutales bacterium TMED158]
MSILADILTIVLALLSVFLVLIVLAQKGNANGGMGAAMGGGMAESALGAETTTVLTNWTRNTAIVFFVLVFGLGLARIYLYGVAQDDDGTALPEFDAPAADAAGLLETLTDGETTAEQAAEALGEQTEQAAEPKSK